MSAAIEYRLADNAVVVTESGVATENRTQDTDGKRITGPWTEPLEQGGAECWRSEDCRRELLHRGDGERSEFHAEECALR